MKYFIKKINLPMDIIDEIWKFVDNFYFIKNLPVIWYKRLITEDYLYYNTIHKHLCLKQEENALKILKKSNATLLIQNIHNKNLHLI